MLRKIIILPGRFQWPVCPDLGPQGQTVPLHWKKAGRVPPRGPGEQDTQEKVEEDGFV